MSLPSNQTACPANTNTSASCNAVPNAIFISSTSGSSTNGTCNCCLTDGTSYVNTSITTPGSNPCTPCPANSLCGDQNGFCNGTTNNANATCVQDPNTLTWSANCSSASCGGLCGGSCGAGEWFAFQSCLQSSGTNACGFSWSQWKSWLVWGIIVFVILLILFFFIFWRKPSTQTVTTVNQTGLPQTTMPGATLPIATTTMPATTTLPITTTSVPSITAMPSVPSVPSIPVIQ